MAIDKFGLTSSELEVIEATVNSGNSSDAELSDSLCRTTGTLHTDWNRIMRRLGVHSRLAAVLFCLENRIVLLKRERED
jgi:DNA-binding NarL/FixJ family response regulator